MPVCEALRAYSRYANGEVYRTLDIVLVERRRWLCELHDAEEKKNRGGHLALSLECTGKSLTALVAQGIHH